MLTRDSKGLTEEQLNEYRASFNHFDKSHRRSLDAKEFRNCLISIGYNISDTTQVHIPLFLFVTIIAVLNFSDDLLRCVLASL